MLLMIINNVNDIAAMAVPYTRFGLNIYKPKPLLMLLSSPSIFGNLFLSSKSAWLTFELIHP